MELESVHLLRAIDSRNQWLVGKLDEGTRELLLGLDFKEAVGYICAGVAADGGDIDECLQTLGIIETAA